MYIEITLKAFFDTPFLVGTGALADVPADKPTLKNGRNQPVIPGSSLKGRLRHTCEALLRTLQQDDNAACHAPDPASTCPLDPARLGRYCPICCLFGSPRRPSPLFFTDLQWTETSVVAPTIIRTGVSIRRNRRVAEPDRLFNLEAVDTAAHAAYQGTIAGYLVDDDSRALVALLLAGLGHLTTLGGGGSSGLGRCRLEVAMRVDERRVDDKAWLREEMAQWLS